jgi:KTSC domain-containing protein
VIEVDREFVASSNVRSIGYDSASNTLEVEFLNGFVYQYYNVPSLVHEELMKSGSKGAFLNSQIKPVYPFSRV